MATLQTVAMTLTSQLLCRMQALVFTLLERTVLLPSQLLLFPFSWKGTWQIKFKIRESKRADLGEQIKISALIHFTNCRTFSWKSVSLNKGLNLSGEVPGRRKNIGDNVTSRACPSVAMNLGRCYQLSGAMLSGAIRNTPYNCEVKQSIIYA